MAILTSIVQLLAWAILLSEGASVATIVIAASATLLGWLGVGLSWQGGDRAAQAGWSIQAVAMALLAVAWAVAVAR